MKKYALLSIVVMMLLVVGCGDSNDMSEEDAGMVYGAVSSAVAKAQGSAMMSMSGMNAKIVEGDGFTYNEEDGSFSGTVESLEGGSADVSGTVSEGEGGQTMTFEMVFNDYVSQGITLNGTITLEYSGSATSYTMKYSGDIEASGDVEGSVDFDLTVSVADGQLTFEGTVGGYDVSGSASYS